MLKVIMEYCQCVDDLPMLVNEVMSKLIETLKVSRWWITYIDRYIYSTIFHSAGLGMSSSCVFIPLQYFNSRTCELVLGAGAVDAVGLKTITARHLGKTACSQKNLSLHVSFPYWHMCGFSTQWVTLCNVYIGLPFSGRCGSLIVHE